MIDAERLMDHFGTEEVATTTINFDGTTVFGTGIDPAMKHGLTNTGAYLATETNVLPLGSTVTLHLDSTPFHGPNGSFRFSRFTSTEPGKPPGRCC